jgi:hypothetical protein
MRNQICSVEVDRFIAAASRGAETHPPKFPGYRLVRDCLLRPQTSIRTYTRVREFINPHNQIRIFLQYQPALPKLAPFKIAITRDDKRRLLSRQVCQIVHAFRSYRLLLVEVAFDFPPESGVNADFVQRYGLFGKSKPRNSHLFADSLRYGGRRCDKLVRCYRKKDLQCFRIELEMHSPQLRRYGLTRFEDLQRLPPLLCPKHIRFVKLDWEATVRHLARRGVSASRIAELARIRSHSVHAALAFLRNVLGVSNPHIFLKPLRINKWLLKALEGWVGGYRNEF